MIYEAKSPAELQHDAHFRLQRNTAEKRDHRQAAPNIKMVVGPWYLDEFGNQTREITARDYVPRLRSRIGSRPAQQ
jgi:hypothetical protein